MMRNAEVLSERLKKYAKRRGFSKHPKWPHLFVNESNVYGLAESRYSPSEEFNDNIVDFDAGLRLFHGEEYLLIKNSKRSLSFNKEYIDEIIEAFHILGSDFLGYSMFQNTGSLILWGVGFWAVLAPRTGEEDFEKEKIDFVRKTKEGSRFFDLKDLIYTERKLHFDWSQLDDHQFVLLCCDIIKSHPQIGNTRITEGSSDLGQDISAIEKLETLLGQEKKKWTIQCKHFMSRKVSAHDIKDISNSYSQLKFDVFSLMTSNFISPGCERLLKSWETMPNMHIRTDIWDRKRIEDFIRNKPEIYTRYFAKMKSKRTHAKE